MTDEELDNAFNKTIDRAVETLEKARKNGRVASGMVISIGYEPRSAYLEEKYPGYPFPRDQTITITFKI